MADAMPTIDRTRIPTDGRVPLDRLRHLADEFDAISAEESYLAVASESVAWIEQEHAAATLHRRQVLIQNGERMVERRRARPRRRPGSCRVYASRRSVTRSASPVGEVAFDGYEFPFIHPGVECETEDTMDRGVAALGPRNRIVKLAQARASGADHEVTDTKLLIDIAGRGQRGQALVVVDLPGQDDVGSGFVQELDEWPDRFARL